MIQQPLIYIPYKPNLIENHQIIFYETFDWTERSAFFSPRVYFMITRYKHGRIYSCGDPGAMKCVGPYQ
jgi:hypothetical protein